MLIQRLREYAEERIPGQLPPMYQEQPIRYRIALDRSGNFLQIFDTASASEKRLKNGERLTVPYTKPTNAVRPRLLADSMPYVLGIGGSDKSSERVRQQHDAFVRLVEECNHQIGEPSVAAVVAFLHTLDVDSLPLPNGFDPTGWATFEIGVERLRPIDLPAVRQFWARHVGTNDDADKGMRLPCIGCGQPLPAMERHPFRIKGVPGGRSQKDLISANNEAFLSYGLKASQIAPTCRNCAEAYSNALNHLLASDDTSFRLREAETAYAFWTREASSFSVARMLSEPEEHQSAVRALVDSPFKGNAASTNLDSNAFYAVGLGSSVARLVVRDWIDSTVGEVQRRLSRYFALQELVDWDGGPGPFLSIYRLTGSTVRDPRKDKPPPIVARSLVRLALAGTPLPMDLLYLAVRRIRASQDVTRERAMLIKMVLGSHQREGVEMTMSDLDQENINSAYLCGRLFATLDEIQHQATKNPVTGKRINAGIVDKFYGSASSAPGSVLGHLMAGAQPHLSKLRKQGGAKERTANALDRRLEDLAFEIQELPTTLSLKDQGLFALGFYHQRAANRRAAREWAQAKAEAAEAEEE